MNLIKEYIYDPTNPVINFQLGYQYEESGQLASATSHYLKAIDNYKEPIKIYESLVRVAMCFEKAGDRAGTVTPLLKRAISIAPKQPEAYYHLARYYEGRREWHDSYMVASVGLELATEAPNKLLGCPGMYALKFSKAVAAWWIGSTEEARQLIYELYVDIDNLDQDFKGHVLFNITNIGYPESYAAYSQEMHKDLRFKFKDSEKITRNHSQVFQDMFVLTALNGKRNGYYLEIGSNHPYRYNNTALLEEQFDWDGVSVDIDFSCVQKFRKDRNNQVIHANALELDYEDVLTSRQAPKIVDYLQVDCEPPQVSFQILQKMPFDTYTFRVITFEHDYYVDPSIKEQSRTFLRSKGYKLVVSDVAFSEGKSFEDWWVHESVFIDPNIQDTRDTVKIAKNYMLNTTAKNTS